MPMSKNLPSLAITILLTSLALANPGTFQVAPFQSVYAVTRNMTLEGWSGGWNQTTTRNPMITVAQGDFVSLLLPSGDIAPHQFFIDVDRDVALPPICPPDKCSDQLPTNYQFTVDFAPGTYKYYCTFHSGQMQGDFVVQGFTVNSNPDSLRIVRASSNMSTITVTSVQSFAGTVNLAATVSPKGPTATVNPTYVILSPDGSQTSTLIVSTAGGTAPGNYVVNVTGTSGSVTRWRTVSTLVVAPDFRISANPSRLVIPLGSTRNSTIMLSSLDAFFGNVALSRNPLPAGMTATLTPTSVTLPSGGKANSTLDVAVTPTFTMPGTYIVNVTCTSGSLTHNVTVTVVAGPDFDISADPATLPLTPGSSGASTITVTSFNNFTGIVDLTGFPSDGPAFSFNPPSVIPPEGGTAASELVVNTSATIAAGNYTLTVNAMRRSIVHSAAVVVFVMDFSVTVSNASLTVQQGSFTTATVSIISLNRFAGVVNLTTTASSSALSRLLSVTTLSLSPSGAAFPVLTINASFVQAGTYTVSITGTSESLVRTVSLSITVKPSPGEASIFPLIGGVAISTIAIAATGSYLMRRRRLRGKTAASQIPT